MRAPLQLSHRGVLPRGCWAGGVLPRGCSRVIPEPIAHLLLDYGASLDRTGKGYSPPLQAAASKGFESIVRLLVSKGAKVHAVGGEYGTALRAALAHGPDEIAKYLLDNGADPMQKSEARHGTLHFTHSNETFLSALEVAVASNKTSTVQLLLDHRLDLNDPEDVCAAAIGRAGQVSGVEMLKFMIGKGANVKNMAAKPCPLIGMDGMRAYSRRRSFFSRPEQIYETTLAESATRLWG